MKYLVILALLTGGQVVDGTWVVPAARGMTRQDVLMWAQKQLAAMRPDLELAGAPVMSFYCEPNELTTP